MTVNKLKTIKVSVYNSLKKKRKYGKWQGHMMKNGGRTE